MVFFSDVYTFSCLIGQLPNASDVIGESVYDPLSALSIRYKYIVLVQT